jgi:hypothetical protein
MENMRYESFVPSSTPLIGKEVKDIKKEFDIDICLINTSSPFFEAFDRFWCEGDYLKIRKFREKYKLF